MGSIPVSCTFRNPSLGEHVKGPELCARLSAATKHCRHVSLSICTALDKRRLISIILGMVVIIQQLHSSAFSW